MKKIIFLVAIISATASCSSSDVTAVPTPQVSQQQLPPQPTESRRNINAQNSIYNRNE